MASRIMCRRLIAQPLPAMLRELAEQMERGDYTESSGAILITKDRNNGLLTVCPWRDSDGLLSEVLRVRGDKAA